MPKFLGFEINGIPKSPKVKTSGPAHKFVPEAKEKHLWIERMGIQTVLDVGAHEGKTVIQFLDLFPQAIIHSFEPIPECYLKLAERTKGHSRCNIYSLAVGESDGEIEFHQSNYSPSSSVLPMAREHEEAFPFTSGGKTVKVKLVTLDSFVKSMEINTPLALKIDVRGYEWQVLCGARKIYPQIKLVIVETSFIELYKGQKQFADICHELTSHGFIYASSFDQLFNPSNGKVIQQDAISIK